MTYAGIQMFMEKLNQLINCNGNPLINNPAIKRERPQFQLLYEELCSMIQTPFIEVHQDLRELDKLNDLKKRLTYAAEEAEYIVDLFLSHDHIRNKGHFPTSENFKSSMNVHQVRRSFKFVVNLFRSCVHIRNNEHFNASKDFKRSLNLDDVSRSFKAFELEFKSMRNNNMKTDSSCKTERTLDKSAPAQYTITKNPLGPKKILDEIFMGLDHDAELIRDKLVEDQKKVDVVSIVGMGGIGKSTLATKVFIDGYVKHHFHVRVWVTVPQTYDKRDVLIQIIESIRKTQTQTQTHTQEQILESICGQLVLEKASNSQLREMVHKNLMGKRYLIVIDDIWHIETWDNLKLFFPHDNNGSRILLTSRLTEVAKHANADGLIHHLGYLNQEKSWELLCQKVFNGNECPEWSIKLGMEIVDNCKGLPLAVVIIAGVLAKEALSEKFWVEIAERTGSYIVGEQNGCLQTLGLSYNHLPLHLRECFLYLGGFPEDYMFKVRELIWLWVAEGFIQQAGDRSLEDTAEGYLMDLIDRNLVIVADRRKSSGVVKACKVHDLVRELCLRKAREEGFILLTERPIMPSNFLNDISPPPKPVRMFVNKENDILGFRYLSIQSLRSILCFRDFKSWSDDIDNSFCNFVLLRVLDIESCKLSYFPNSLELLIHLRYLAVWNSSYSFPSSICNLWSLQTLILLSDDSSVLPSNISDLANLRHLWSYHPSNRERNKRAFYILSIEKPTNLQTISGVELGDGVDNFQKCFPYIKELTCTTYIDEENDFKSLTCLEKLNLTGLRRRKKSTVHLGEASCINIYITFPATLKTLTLAKCRLPWSYMSIIRSLPNLQILKLHNKAFEGSCWNTDEQEFRQLKFLRLQKLKIKHWEAYSTSFPYLRRLEINWCKDLEEIPLEIGNIPKLELIKIKKCRHSVGESVRRIQEEQHDFGNYDQKIDISDCLSS